MAIDDDKLWAELGKAVRHDGLGMLPEEEERNPSDAQAGRWYFSRQFENIKKIYCNETISSQVTDDKKRDVVVFVSSLIDIFSAYFGVVAGTIILVQIYKIGVDRVCGLDGLANLDES